MSHMRVGAITRSAGLSAAIECVEPEPVVARRATTVRDRRGVLHSRHVDELARDERPGERRRHRRAIGVHRAGLERRHGVVANELFAHVDDMRT